VKLPLNGLFLMLTFIGGCTHVNPYFNPAKPHHRPSGFDNNYVVSAANRDEDIKYRPQGETPIAFPLAPFNSELLAANRTRNSVSFIGHATVHFQLGGLNVLTDPQFSKRASPVGFAGPQRLTPPGATIKQLPHIDLIVISHNHYDHLDLPSLYSLLQQPGGQPMIAVPLGNGQLLRALGAKRIQELDWWDHIELQGTRISSVPVHHWSARTFLDRNRSLWSGWVVENHAGKVFFAGDTAYSSDFKDIGAHFGAFDLAIIPIGAYAPRSEMKGRHVNPAEAVQIHLDLHAKQSLGIHWGSFELTDEPLDEPLRDLTKAIQKARLPTDTFFVLNHGETKFLERVNK
jgi:N-acyl-phosphatidylethanolamine-hydrolysing phospholipase D